jgi:polyhydroxyalkanoate synthase
VPWQGALQSVQHLLQYNQNINFVLSSSGHIAGIVNPPTPNSKRHYYIMNNKSTEKLEETKHLGSWWTNWNEWLTKNSIKVHTKNKKLIKKYDSLYQTPSKYVQEKC